MNRLPHGSRCAAVSCAPLRDVKQAVAAGASAQTAPTLLTEFVAAARAADSFDDALRSALSTLCSRIGVESAVLLEKTADQHIAEGLASVPSTSTEWTVPVDGFLVSRLTAYPMPLPFERDELAALSEWAAANRPDRLDEIRRSRQARRSDGGAAADARPRSWASCSWDRRAITVSSVPAEKQVLRSCADQFALMMENARLTDRVVGQEVLRRDLALAAEVQKRLLPSAPPVGRHR